MEFHGSSSGGGGGGDVCGGVTSFAESDAEAWAREETNGCGAAGAAEDVAVALKYAVGGDTGDRRACGALAGAESGSGGAAG